MYMVCLDWSPFNHLQIFNWRLLSFISYLLIYSIFSMWDYNHQALQMYGYKTFIVQVFHTRTLNQKTVYIVDTVFRLVVMVIFWVQSQNYTQKFYARIFVINLFLLHISFLMEFITLYYCTIGPVMIRGEDFIKIVLWHHHLLLPIFSLSH
jgi:hypothetical protein